jgi:Uma2 family endonuclease
MSAKRLFSLEEFERLPDDDMRHELDEGKLVTTAPPRFLQSRIAKQLYDSILIYRVAGQVSGEVLSGAAYLLYPSAKDKTVRQPDVSYVNDDRPKTTARGSYMEGAPDLAIEVVSPSDTAEQMARKVRQYLTAGAESVWVVYPATREVHVFFSPAGTQGAVEAKILNDGGVLTEPGLFPGWEGIPLATLFE